LCKSRLPGDLEHILPDALGGKLQVSILCNDCNHGRGAELVAKVKKDPSLRLAVEALQRRIPAFAHKFLEKAEYAGRVSDGSVVRASRRAGSLEVIASKGILDSVIIDTKEAEIALAKKLKRSGVSKDEIATYTKRFSELIEDEPLALPTGDIFVKRPMPHLKPHFGNSVFLDERLFVLIALEFAAVILGDRVLRPSFDPAREYILGSSSSDSVQVRQMLARRPYEPVHTLMLREKDDLLAVQVKFFGCIAGEVTFSTISYRGIDPIYLEDLEAPGSYYALDHKHAEQNQWILLG
jgi:hypothetical protein